MIEELLIAQLPKAWKHLPDCLGRYRDSIVITGLTAERRLESLLDLKLIRELKAVE